MSNYDEGRGGVQDAPLSREPVGDTATFAPTGAQAPSYGSPQPPLNPGYGGPGYGGQGYGMPAYGMQQQWGMRPRRTYPIETKPFFLTSEFVGAVLAIAGIAITAASSEAFGAWRAWILISAITGAYMISRGIAKSGTRSHADDPREHLDLNWGRGDQQQHAHEGR